MHRADRWQAVLASALRPSAFVGRSCTTLAGRESDRVSRKCLEKLLVLGHELYPERHGKSHEFTVVRRAVTIADEFENQSRVHLVFGARQKALGFQLQFACGFEGECLSSNVAGENVPELTAPLQRRGPTAVHLQTSPP